MKKFLLIISCLIPAIAAADCFDDAAAAYQVNPWILRGIAHVESRFNPAAINRNTNGTIDIGMMQTNSIHLPRLAKYGITRQDIMQPCTSVHVAAWMLREKMNKHGNTWNAVGAYHSETPFYRDRYAAKVRAIIRKWSSIYDVQ